MGAIHMNRKNWLLASLLVISSLMLTACGDDPEAKEKEETSSGKVDQTVHLDIPMDLQVATDPQFPVGSTVLIKEGHIPGMEGVKATVSGAYATVAYSVTYTPTNGGERVEGHKWIVHEEIEEYSDQPFEKGEQVTLKASHKEGMENAKAVIESVQDTTVYTVDFTTTDGEIITNYKWVTEEELSSAEADPQTNSESYSDEADSQESESDSESDE